MEQNQKGARPTHVVYVVEGKGDDARWTRVGAAWAHEDGNGLNIALNRLVVRKATSKDQTQEGAR